MLSFHWSKCCWTTILSVCSGRWRRGRPESFLQWKEWYRVDQYMHLHIISIMSFVSFGHVQIHTSIPYSVEFLIIAVEIACVLTNAVIREMWHGSKVCLQVAEGNIASGIVVDVEVSETTAVMKRLNRVIAWSSDLEPQCLVNGNILRGIGTIRGDP